MAGPTVTTVLDMIKSAPAFLATAVNRQITLSQTSTTDVWTFKESDGSTLYAITVTYTSATKLTIDNIQRTT